MGLYVCKLCTAKMWQTCFSVRSPGVSIAQFICDQLYEGIEETGPDTVVHVCTDSAASCKAAGALVMQRWDSNMQHGRSTSLVRLV
jgi:hypothetical protein